MAEYLFPQVLTMAKSPNCFSVWTHSVHCLYSCHWRKCPKDRMKTSQVE